MGEFVRNRMEDFHTRILYMSGSKEHLLELFDSQPVGFLEKPLTREKVNSGMDRILRQMEENSFCSVSYTHLYLQALIMYLRMIIWAVNLLWI